MKTNIIKTTTDETPSLIGIVFDKNSGNIVLKRQHLNAGIGGCNVFTKESLYKDLENVVQETPEFKGLDLGFR